MNAAIYHFTDQSEKRPKIYQDQLKQLEEYAVSQGFTVKNIFCDKSLRRCEHSEFERFLSSSDQYDVLIAKDYYHIGYNTQKCIQTMMDLRKKGLAIYTLVNGAFSDDEAPLNSPLKIATYSSHFGSTFDYHEIPVIQNDVLQLYAQTKTNWSVQDQYQDVSEFRRENEMHQLRTLINNRDKYDLLLVHNLNQIHWRTAAFCRLRDQLQLDIFSLQEGFFKYRKEDST